MARMLTAAAEAERDLSMRAIDTSHSIPPHPGSRAVAWTPHLRNSIATSSVRTATTQGESREELKDGECEPQTHAARHVQRIQHVIGDVCALEPATRPGPQRAEASQCQRAGDDELDDVHPGGVAALASAATTSWSET